MPHRDIDPAAIKEKELELIRIHKAIERLRIYHQAKDDKTVQKLLEEVRVLCKNAIASKDDAIEKNATWAAGIWRGEERAYKYILESFTNAEREIEGYRERARQCEIALRKLRETKRG
jgi:hypothetical protein